MYNIMEAPFVKEMCDAASNMYRMGWDERNGGNISYRLDAELVGRYLDLGDVKRRIEIGFDASGAAGEIYIVTGTGNISRTLPNAPRIIWGFSGWRKTAMRSRCFGAMRAEAARPVSSPPIC